MMVDPPKRAFPDRRSKALVAGQEKEVVIDPEAKAVVIGERAEAPAILGREAHRLFEENRFPRPEQRFRDLEMQERRHQDVDDVAIGCSEFLDRTERMGEAELPRGLSSAMK